MSTPSSVRSDRAAGALIAPRAAPANARGLGHWVRTELLDSPLNGVVTALIMALLLWQLHDLVSWALRRGRAALFADTGLGKTSMQVEWARVVSERAGRVLILAPLAVAEQTVNEARRFGVSVVYARHGDETNI